MQTATMQILLFWEGQVNQNIWRCVMFLDNKIILRAAALIALLLVLSGCGGGPLPPPCTTDFLIVSINNANGNGPGLDTINLDPGCVYELGIVDNTIDGNNGLPSITTSIVINGNGATVRRSTGAQKAARGRTGVERHHPFGRAGHGTS
jgi:hypothetical protein